MRIGNTIQRYKPKVSDFIMNGHCLKYCAIALGLIAYEVITDEYKVKNEKLIDPKSGWEETTRVLASTGQNCLGRGTPNSSYTLKLANLIEQDNFSSIESANKELEDEGYRILYSRYNSLATESKPLGIFNKSDSLKNRFLLVISQDSCNSADIFQKHANIFFSKFKKLYNISSENSVRIIAKSNKDFVVGLDSISHKIARLKDKSNVELLIEYMGHGHHIDSNDSLSLIEGANEGAILPIASPDKKVKSLIKMFKETELKLIFKENFKGIKTLFVIDACHSGAFISEANVKKVLKLLG